ncbi:MAG: hypothetical protein ABI693_02350 [Bryobacteraceae bacterium]
MNKRLLKRHKRQVARAKEHVKLSEPDLRTPEQITAAKEASRAPGGRNAGTQSHYNATSIRNPANTSGHSAAKADA